MKVLRMNVDNVFLKGENFPKPAFYKHIDTTVFMRDVDSVTPFEKYGTTYFKVDMKSGDIYHARYDIQIVRE